MKQISKKASPFSLNRILLMLLLIAGLSLTACDLGDLEDTGIFDTEEDDDDEDDERDDGEERDDDDEDEDDDDDESRDFSDMSLTFNNSSPANQSVTLNY